MMSYFSPNAQAQTATRLLVPLLLTSLAAGCSATQNAGFAPPQSVPEAAAPAPVEQQQLADSAPEKPQPPAAPPQLVKTAQLSLEVKSVDEGVKAATAILKSQRGDLLSLQDNRPIDVSAPYTVQMQLRVPQSQLETTLAALGKLGTIQSQSLRAEDVSTQLVDSAARLRNLRRTESSLLELMSRSGSVGDVLKVSQELSRVRENIEQLDAQLTNLRNQVAFSTIDLTLLSAVGNLPPQSAWSTQLQEAWATATRSLSDFSLAMLKLLLWLLVYSPYWGSILALVLLWRRHRRSHPLASPPRDPRPPAGPPEGATPGG